MRWVFSADNNRLFGISTLCLEFAGFKVDWMAGFVWGSGCAQADKCTQINHSCEWERMMSDAILVRS